MNNEKNGMAITAISLIFAIWLISVGFLYIRLRDTQTRLTELERGTSERIEEVQGNFDVELETLRTEMADGFDKQQTQIDEARQIQGTTNKALVRFIRQSKHTEEEIREELKKD